MRQLSDISPPAPSREITVAPGPSTPVGIRDPPINGLATAPNTVQGSATVDASARVPPAPPWDRRRLGIAVIVGGGGEFDGGYK